MITNLSSDTAVVKKGAVWYECDDQHIRQLSGAEFQVKKILTRNYNVFAIILFLFITHMHVVSQCVRPLL